MCCLVNWVTVLDLCLRCDWFFLDYIVSFYYEFGIFAVKSKWV